MSGAKIASIGNDKVFIKASWIRTTAYENIGMCQPSEPCGGCLRTFLQLVWVDRRRLGETSFPSSCRTSPAHQSTSTSVFTRDQTWMAIIFAMSSKQANARVTEASRRTSGGFPSPNKPIRVSTRDADNASSSPSRCLITLQSTLTRRYRRARGTRVHRRTKIA